MDAANFQRITEALRLRLAVGDHDAFTAQANEIGGHLVPCGWKLLAGTEPDRRPLGEVLDEVFTTTAGTQPVPRPLPELVDPTLVALSFGAQEAFHRSIAEPMVERGTPPGHSRRYDAPWEITTPVSGAVVTERDLREVLEDVRAYRDAPKSCRVAPPYLVYLGDGLPWDIAPDLFDLPDRFRGVGPASRGELLVSNPDGLWRACVAFRPLMPAEGAD